ncbi:MAG: LysR substrate-binding domain-containing protein [Nannocystaceae bacterium]
MLPTAPLPLTLRQLQYVVAVADVGSFRGAAERCRVAQPSLSAQVAEVEASLGVRLFERDRRRVLITRAGAAVIERARRLLVDVQELSASARRFADPLAGELRLGVIPTVAPYLLPELAPRLREAFPRLSIVWVEERTAALAARLRGGELDAMLVALEADLGEVEHLTLGRDELVLAAPVGHPLGRARRPIREAELDGARVLLLDDGHCLRDQALSLCARLGAEEDGLRATSLATLVPMVAAGAGVTLLPAMALSVENRRGALKIRRFAGKAPARTIALCWRPGSALQAALRPLGQAMRAAFPAAEAAGAGESSRSSR